MLGINWLQLVNPMVDWGGARLYVPNAVHTALLQGDWLLGHVQSGTITVLSGEKELEFMKEKGNAKANINSEMSEILESEW